MHINKIDNTSFGRIGFTEKSVKKAFYEALDKPNRFTSRYSNTHIAMKKMSEFWIKQENNRHDRLLKIGMKEIKGKIYFTNATTNERLGTTKKGRQNIPLFLLELLGYTR